MGHASGTVQYTESNIGSRTQPSTEPLLQKVCLKIGPSDVFRHDIDQFFPFFLSRDQACLQKGFADRLTQVIAALRTSIYF